MTEPGGPTRREPFSTSDVVEFLKRHKVLVAGVLTPVVASEVTNVVGPVVRWAVRGALLALILAMVAILYIRRRGMLTRSRKRMSAIADRFRPPDADDENDENPPAPPPSAGSGRKRRKVAAVTAAVLVVSGAVAVAVLTSDEGGGGEGGEAAPTGSEASSSEPETDPPTASPDAPASYVGESIAAVMPDLRADGVRVDVEILVDPEEEKGTIVEQDPDPLSPDGDAVEFAITGRKGSTPLDAAFVVAGGGSWREGGQTVFGTPYEHGFYLRDGDCFEDPYYCDYQRKSPVLALNLSRNFEIFTATLGFDERSPTTDAARVEVILHGPGAEEGKVVCSAEVRPVTPLRLRLDVSGQGRLEFVFRPWRNRQIPAIGEPTGIFVDTGLRSPPATRPENLLPTPPTNDRCYG